MIHEGFSLIIVRNRVEKKMRQATKSTWSPTFLVTLLALLVIQRSGLASEAVVEFKQSIDSNNSLIVGVLDLGQLESGSNHQVTFKLVNLSGVDLDFARTKSSCVCSKVTIPAGVLKEGKSFDSKAEVRLTVPPIRTSKRTISEVEIFASKGDSPVAILRIVGAIMRPFYFRNLSVTLSLEEPEVFKYSIPFELDEGFDISGLGIDWTVLEKVTVHREEGGRGRLEVHGDRKKCLEQRVSQIIVSKGPIKDCLVLNFFDALAVRVFPTHVSRSDTISLKVLCKKPTDAESIRCERSDGRVIRSSLSNISGSLQALNVELPADFNDKLFFVVGDSFRIQIDVD